MEDNPPNAKSFTTVARFLDTNILVYAEDLDAGQKREKALDLLIDCWNSGDGVVSVQVLKEFYVTVTRKLQSPMASEKAEAIVGEYLTWRVVESDSALLRNGIRLSRSASLSLWDSLIIEAALRAGCDRLYSEDLNHGQRFGHLEIVNPLLGTDE